MNPTCPHKEDLLLYVEGAMRRADAEAVSDHLECCEACTAEVARLLTLTNALRAAANRGGERGHPRTSKLQRGVCPDAAEIAAYVDGSLEPGTIERVEKHVAACGSCLTEVADLLSIAGAADRDAPDTAVAAVLARLEEDSRTAVVRWAERSLEVVRDFATGLAVELSDGFGSRPEPAAALSRAALDEVRLHWCGGGGAIFEGVVRAGGSGPTLTGRVTVEGSPATTTSVALAAFDSAEGPESLDADGRFGPWRLSSGRNLLRLTGLPGTARGAAELVVLVEPVSEQDR